MEKLVFTMNLENRFTINHSCQKLLVVVETKKFDKLDTGKNKDEQKESLQSHALSNYDDSSNDLSGLFSVSAADIFTAAIKSTDFNSCPLMMKLENPNTPESATKDASGTGWE
ncbi:hypothetical protein AYI69_g8088 [Smittium culicis]|uniref:Uncharacterized protein n=1 Tax=Smittium culicis TaxID=133412 RepID=A0A1R1XMA2_9FUNG|nr:hypothetical protein AYI69_g8088 [Smittium culicis]